MMQTAAVCGWGEAVGERLGRMPGIQWFVGEKMVMGRVCQGGELLLKVQEHLVRRLGRSPSAGPQL